MRSRTSFHFTAVIAFAVLGASICYTQTPSVAPVKQPVAPVRPVTNPSPDILAATRGCTMARGRIGAATRIFRRKSSGDGNSGEINGSGPRMCYSYPALNTAVVLCGCSGYVTPEIPRLQFSPMSSA